MEKSVSFSPKSTTANYVEGNVGMARGKFKKLRGIKRFYRHGVLVINLVDGGTLSFYNNTEHPDVTDGNISVFACMETSIDESEEEPYLRIPAVSSYDQRMILLLCRYVICASYFLLSCVACIRYYIHLLKL